MYNLIEIRRSNTHGKGVFALEDIPKDTVLICDILKIKSNSTELTQYEFPFSNKNGNSCICIGFGSFFNHNRDYNVIIYKLDKANMTLSFITIEEISKNEELFLKYNDDIIF